MGPTASELANRFGLSVRTIHKYAHLGVIPAPARTGRGATYDPICIPLLEQLRFNRDYHTATLQELAERRSLTGQLLPPEGRKPPVIDRGAL